MLPSHIRAIRDITNCRTEVLGGQSYLCPKCGQFRYSYHSCKNRHCPKCGNDQASEWLQKHFDQLPPVPHFLVTFTLPDPLRKLARSHQKIVYEILITTACRSLEVLGWNHKWIGGLIGSVAVLQTWTRDLRYHPHVHVVVTGGGLSADGNHWMPAKNNFLLPAAALAKVFRGKFRHQLAQHDFYKNVPSHVWPTDWIVDIRPVGSGQSAFRYLAPYIFRVALSNKRILSCKDGNVIFVYKDSDSSIAKFKRVTLPAEHFIHRFLQHVLPFRFRKVRHYGLFSPHKKRLLLKAFKLLAGTTAKPKSDHQQPTTKTLLCPECSVPMILVQILPRLKFLPVTVRSP